MKRFSMILVSVLVFGLSLAAVAGDGHYKQCTASAQECLNKQVSYFKDTAWDGIHVDLGENKPMTVKEVLADSPGEKAGIQVGDVLVSLNGKKLADLKGEELNKTMGTIKIGEVATYIIKRGHDKQKVKVTMAEFPMEMAAKWVGKHMIKGHAGEKVASY